MTSQGANGLSAQENSHPDGLDAATCNVACNDERDITPAEARRLANLTVRHQHLGWQLWRSGSMPALPWGPEVQTEVEELVGHYVSRCGGPERVPFDAMLRIRQLGLAFGFTRLVEEWAVARGTRVTHPKHGRLPQAFSRDWLRFSVMQRELLDELKPFFVENQTKPVSPLEYLRQTQGAHP